MHPGWWPSNAWISERVALSFFRSLPTRWASFPCVGVTKAVTFLIAQGYETCGDRVVGHELALDAELNLP